jgi:Zn-dependent peptidase ImmA (M78 family)/transcriptional regulator with XRE-family HTH domain
MLFNVAKILSRPDLDIEGAAARTGLAGARLHEIASGAEPSLAELKKISEHFKVPVSALLDGPDDASVRPLFRKSTSAPLTDVYEEVAEESISRSISDLLPLVDGIPRNSDWLDAFSDLSPTTANAEAYAARFRGIFNGIGDLPLQNLSDLVANYLGVFLVLRSSREVEGASAVVADHAFVFLSYRTFRARMLFTLAHEVGHLVAHAKLAARNFACLDKDGETNPFGRTRNDEERFANAFANALLLPRASVLRFLKAVRRSQNLRGPLGDIELCYLARFFGVGFEVAGLRCEELELLPRGGARTLYVQLRDEYGSPEKRADSVGIPQREVIAFETSDALLNAGVRKIRSGDASLGYIAEVLGVPVSLLIAKNAETLQ